MTTRKTLQDWMREPYVFRCNKRGLAPNAEFYADEQIDELTQSEFLSELSDAFENMLKQARDKKAG